MSAPLGVSGGDELQSEPVRQPEHELSLQDILAIENDDAILEHICPATDLLLWPLVRIVLIRMIMSDLLYGRSLDGIQDRPSVSRSGLGTLARSAWHNRRGMPTSDICIISTAVANQYVDGAWFNRLTDPFALESPAETLVIEEPFEWQWQMPRRFERVRFLSPRLALGALLGRIRVSTAQRASAARLVDLVLARAQAALGWDCGAQRRGHLIDMLSAKAAALPTQYRAYESWLNAIRPKLLIVTGGCYGPMSPLIVAANRRRIRTAEYQHGAVSTGHDGYNLAPVLAAASAWRESLPNEFLGYGSWWHEQFNAPVTKRVIGNPHRERQLAKLKLPMRARRRVLILSDGIEFSLYLRHASEIAAVATPLGFDVVLRPHPLERTAAVGTYGHSIGQVRLDQEQDLYASLAEAHVVVSEVSTGLFEAVGIADKILVWDTAKARFAFPSHPFHRYRTVSDFIELLIDERAGRLESGVVSAIWAPSWASNYRALLDDVGVPGGDATDARERLG
jgi:hypothetical protein